MSAAIGSALSNARTATATSSNGLAYMWEMLHIASSMRAPIIMELVCRSISGPLNIHNDHSDAMGMKDTGWIMLFSKNNQDVYDNTIIGTMIAENSNVLLPIAICQDGFITSHSIENMEILQDDDVNEDIDIIQKENNTTKFESNNEHQTFVLDLAKSEMLKLCKNQITVDTALITHRHKIQSLYKFLGKEKFLETFEKIKESAYLQEQSKNAGQFFNWMFSSKKENFLSVFNDVYIDKSKAITENETTSDYSQLSEKDFDMDSMWEG